ncbi:MAG: M55 family metallopeptidase [Gammaproteobacteria bacterium]
MTPRLACFISTLFAIGTMPTSVGASHRHASAPADLKVYISVDMEGVAGVVTADQLNPAGFEYERFRRFMTDEAMAAVRAAKDAGATEVVVSDSHGNGESLLVEQFPKDVRVVRSFPRHGAMMAGLDSTFAAAVLIGNHASTTNTTGVRAHTVSSAHFARLALNDRPVTEAEFNAAYAGDLNVPVIFVSGDDAAVREIQERLGPIDSVATKTSLGFHSAETLIPAEACDRIYKGVLAAMAHREQRAPFKIAHPIRLDLTFKNYMPAEVLAYLRVVKRVDSHSIQFVGQDMREVSDFVDFVDFYNADATP